MGQGQARANAKAITELERFAAYPVDRSQEMRLATGRHIVIHRLIRLLIRGVQLCVALCIFAAGPAVARTNADIAARCDAAAAKAASATGVPAAVLMAIARVETGRTVAGTLAPWPWTVNEAGAGSWFDTADQAARHASDAISKGATNIDIGCFQVNWRWHGDAFQSLEAMFDPVENALYAAGFLNRLYEEHGSWEGAIGAYHSRHDDAAERYVAKVAAVLGAPMATPAPQAVATAAPRENRYPLLQGGVSRGNGSLFSSEDTPGAQPLFR